jgi:magnesium chelatase family protein
MKPCPCGHFGDPVKECSCSPKIITRYQKKINVPLLECFDIHVEVPRIDYQKLADKRNVEDSKTIRTRVQAARESQLERFNGTKITRNAEMGQAEVREFCQTDSSGEKLLNAVKQLHLPATANHRVLKLARTIADLAASEMIAANHVAEAVHYEKALMLDA